MGLSFFVGCIRTIFICFTNHVGDAVPYTPKDVVIYAFFRQLDIQNSISLVNMYVKFSQEKALDKKRKCCIINKMKFKECELK